MRYGIALLAASVVLVAACTSSKTTTVNTSNGPVTVTQSSGAVVYESKEGKVNAGMGAVDPASLGLPIYPGATPNEGGSLAAQTKEGSAKLLTMETKDPFDKVYQFYKDKMPAGSEQSHMSAGANSMASFQIGKEGDKVRKQVIITSSGDKVTISMIVGGP